MDLNESSYSLNMSREELHFNNRHKNISNSYKVQFIFHDFLSFSLLIKTVENYHCKALANKFDIMQRLDDERPIDRFEIIGGRLDVFHNDFDIDQ